jgi:hypothetical protein
MVREQIRLPYAQFPVQDDKTLALDAPDVALAEDTAWDAERPVCILQCRVVGVFVCADEGSEKDTLEDPCRMFDAKMGAHARDVD